MNTTTTEKPQLALAEEAAAWLQERYRTDRMREGLKKLLGALDEARTALDRARRTYRETEAEVERVDATLALTVASNPDLKNAEARKAALDVARASDPERVSAAAAFVRAVDARNQAANQLDDLEATVQATHLAIGLATAEMQAVAAIVQLPPF